jgi:glycosyltransferase involved in cell wall biosynthesis
MVSVSVVMACYNHEKYVAQAIESVLKQSFSDLDLVIVDDNSNDDSLNIIMNYASKDSRVRPFFHQKNMGIARTFNDCLKESRGQYLGFIGSDDAWLPHKLANQLELIKGNEDKILWSNGQIINSMGALTGQGIFDLTGGAAKTSGNLFQELLTEDFILGQSVLLKTEFAREIGFDERYRFVNDHLFFIELARRHEFLFDPSPTALYRIHTSNTTSLYPQTWYKERIMLRNQLLQTYHDQMAPQTLADIYYKLGHAYDGLGKRRTAKYYYLKALGVHQVRANSILYLLSIGNQGFLGAHLERSYKKLLSVVANRQRLAG